MLHLIAIDFALLLITGYLLRRAYIRKHSGSYSALPLPPGPKGRPFVGNYYDLPAAYEWKTYHKWAKGLDTEILYLNVAGTPMVVLDTYDVALELLERRSSKYSGRMQAPMVKDLMGWDFSIGWMDYGATWRQQRTLIHQSFHPTATEKFRPQQLRITRFFLQKLSPMTDVLQELRQMAGETIISVTYGIDVLPKNDPYLEASNNAVLPLLEAGIPGAFLVDLLPWLKYVPGWIPGAGFQRKAKKWKEATIEMLNRPFDEVLAKMKEGTARPSFVVDALEKIDTEEKCTYTEYNVKSVAGALFQAGSDSTVSAIGFGVITLLNHPEIVRKMQNEIDNVTDGVRLPDFDDETSMPYLAGVIKEILRFWSVTPLAMAHYLHVDDEYNGYRLPAGSVIIANAWAMLHNEEVFKNPFEFNPDRFLQGDKIAENHLNAVWGFGRRICPGRFMVLSQMWIVLASTFSVYDIEKVRDTSGNVIEPSEDFPPSILASAFFSGQTFKALSSSFRFPHTFHVNFKPRSSAARQLLSEIVQETSI